MAFRSNSKCQVVSVAQKALVTKILKPVNIYYNNSNPNVKIPGFGNQ